MELVHLAPYIPGDEEPWDGPAVAGHLLRRSGFGAAPQDVARVAERGLELAVPELFDEAPDQETEFQRSFDHINGSLMNFGDPAQLQMWWCHRMLRTRTPLREKLTLFWHGHFATSHVKVVNQLLMHRQNETLRLHTWGNFRDLLLAVSRDPAMLVYLDGEANTKEHPNENYARELLELFTLGIGQYTENDVREAARAFTGWRHDGGKFVFDAEAHDAGDKVFLGKRGALDGTDIIAILLRHPALSLTIARKLLEFFCCPQPAEDVLAEAADVLKQANFNIKSFLSTLFLSKFFYSPACRRKRISSPVEFAIGACRSLEARMPAGRLREHLVAMGQELLAPPSVKGWEGGQKWIHTTTWAARIAFAQELADLYGGNEFYPHLDIHSIVPSELVDTTMIVDKLAQRLLEGKLSETKRAEIANFLITKNDQPDPNEFRTNEEFRTQQVRAALGIMLSLPEYHAY
jgi:hypothetical protein